MPPLDASMPDRIRAAAQDASAKHQIPGMSIGVVLGNDLVFSEGFGFADIESKEPMLPSRRQRIASITKTMVGLCAMTLVDEGRLTLKSRVVDLLPDIGFEGPAGGITVRHLLTHTSGIGEAPRREQLVDIANPDRGAVEHPGDFSTLYPKGIVVEAEPGTKWAYCNNGFALLGAVIERTEEADLQDVMQRRIWNPLGMLETDIRDENNERISTCYHRAPNEDTRFQLERAGIPVRDEPTVDGKNMRGKFTAEFNRGMRAAGGVQSTVGDMAKYASALLRRGAGIVRPETFEAMAAPQYCPDVRLDSWGLSFARVPRYGRTLIGHGGSYFGGWNSHLDVILEDGIGIIQHMNVMLDDPAPIFRSIQRAVLDAAVPVYDRGATDPTVLEAAPGMYELVMPGPLTNFRPQTRTGRIQIEREGDGLKLQSRWGPWKRGVPLLAADRSDPGFFAIEREGDDTAYLSLVRDRGGRVTGLRFDELVYMVRRPD